MRWPEFRKTRAAWAAWRANTNGALAAEAERQRKEKAAAAERTYQAALTTLDTGDTRREPTRRARQQVVAGISARAAGVATLPEEQRFSAAMGVLDDVRRSLVANGSDGSSRREALKRAEAAIKTVPAEQRGALERLLKEYRSLQPARIGEDEARRARRETGRQQRVLVATQKKLAEAQADLTAARAAGSPEATIKKLQQLAADYQAHLLAMGVSAQPGSLNGATAGSLNGVVKN